MKNILKNKRVRKRALLAAIVILPSIAAVAIKLDLSGSATSGSLMDAVGGTAIFSETSTHPAGTGVFDPFLTLNSQGNNRTESGYNTDGHTALYLDQQRPNWNNLLKVIGSAKSLLSIDNIRIYTSSTDNTAAVQSDESKLESPSPVGTLRFALNDPLKSGSKYNIANWVKMDVTTDGIADTRGHNGGSGFSDFEDRRAVVGDHPVPDSGVTAVLLGWGLVGIAGVRARFGRK